MDHEPRVEIPLNNRPSFSMARTVGSSLFHDLLLDLFRHDRRRRIGAHAAGVRPLVSVEHPLVVLRRRHGDHGLPSVKAMNDASSPLRHSSTTTTSPAPPKTFLVMIRSRALTGLLDRLRDNHALACGETRRLSRQWSALASYIDLGLGPVRKGPVSAEGYVLPHQVLVKALFASISAAFFAGPKTRSPAF